MVWKCSSGSYAASKVLPAQNRGLEAPQAQSSSPTTNRRLFFVAIDDDIDTSSADNDVGDRPTVATSTSPANGRRRQVPTSGDPSPPVVHQSTPTPTPAVRKSTPTVKPLQRLHYDQDFNEVYDFIFT
ncbi:hypothetical protein MTO96_023362 [Rhipicephalus appendiculatus]